MKFCADSEATKVYRSQALEFHNPNKHARNTSFAFDRERTDVSIDPVSEKA
ncbi:MAG TPA: hypothetical protein VFB65_19380 [Pyrinomonadaceae bacterium]|nr:hypothetical protein [Pyrinomonadaceae bacterium]